MKRSRFLVVVIMIAAGAAVLAVSRLGGPGPSPLPLAHSSREITLIKEPATPADKIVNRAKREAIRQVRYDASYLSIRYPNGDVPQDQGACTDVIVRALRAAGYDLQKLMHEDMKRNFRLYPKKWELKAPDSNIDHRRVPNHLVFMGRFARGLPKSITGDAANTWKPGDLVYWDLNGRGMTHCGVISNDRGACGLPMVIHNIGPCASQDDCLDYWKIIGHFRYPSS